MRATTATDDISHMGASTFLPCFNPGLWQQGGNEAPAEPAIHSAPIACFLIFAP